MLGVLAPRIPPTTTGKIVATYGEEKKSDGKVKRGMYVNEANGRNSDREWY